MFRSSPRLPGLRLSAVTSEHVLGTIGCAIAVASGSFGLYMNLYGPSEPDVNGREYLTIFAQASHRSKSFAPVDAAGALARSDSPGIDPAPTGSILDGKAQHEDPATGGVGPAKPSLLKDFRLRDVFGDTALVEDHARLRIVQVGTVLSGAGRVMSIEQHDGQWSVVTSEGVITNRATNDN